MAVIDQGRLIAGYISMNEVKEAEHEGRSEPLYPGK
jgi:hypothetical protein